MRISLKRGNIVYLLVIGLVYFIAVFTIPSLLPLTLDVNLKLNIVLGLASVATIIMISYSLKVKNDIESGQKKYDLITLFAIGIIGFIAMMIFQVMINSFLQYLARFFEFQTSSKNTDNIVQILNFKPIFVLYVAVLGPIMEELFFRKAVFGYFYDIMLGSKKWIRFLIPACITGIIFAIPHDGFSPLMIIYIAMSMVFSFLYLKTKSIIAPMAAHILMNSLVVAIQLFVK
ncbi:CPBP family intramembrane glutamic endopeptidase [Gemella cuniculi]|uniref:CPBP family intramembrane glutamic endopeptidase n=1 Tax=Gemella cuniculi TaxID=150240 RepID=UPI0003F4E180|nr:type II CAAX endopeptidase family protein [Gemella cuniculi]